MQDFYGRNITYLRISVTDLCNLRCFYCMPPEGVIKCSHSEICSFEELKAMASAAVSWGIRKIRITGGEPLVRRGIVDFCRMLRSIPGLEELCLTTNGTLLPSLAVPLREAGVDRLNISLDTLRGERFRKITRGGRLDDVLSGIEAAEKAGFDRLKLNCVLLGGINDDEIPDFVGLTVNHPWQVRFIELMPMDRRHLPASFIPISRVSECCPDLKRMGNDGVSSLYQLPGALGSVGLIAPLSHEFCSECTRLRITADGHLKPCLHSDSELMLRGLRGDELSDAIRKGIEAKPASHHLTKDGVSNTHRQMNEIGG